MKKENPWNWIPAVAIVVLLLLFAGYKAVKSDSPRIQTNEQESTKQWVEIARFSGNGDEETDYFTTHNNRFRVNYRFYNSYPGAVFGFFIYPKDDGLYVNQFSLSGSGNDSSFVNTPSGEYYFNVITGPGSEWEIMVEEQR